MHCETPRRPFAFPAWSPPTRAHTSAQRGTPRPIATVVLDALELESPGVAPNIDHHEIRFGSMHRVAGALEELARERPRLTILLLLGSDVRRVDHGRRGGGERELIHVRAE